MQLHHVRLRGMKDLITRKQSEKMHSIPFTRSMQDILITLCISRSKPQSPYWSRSHKTKTPPTRQLRATTRMLTGIPWPCQLIAPFPLSLGLGTAELLALPPPLPLPLPPLVGSELGVPLVSALIPPPPYGQPTKLVSGCMKHVKPDAVPLIKLLILAI